MSQRRLRGSSGGQCMFNGRILCGRGPRSLRNLSIADVEEVRRIGWRTGSKYSKQVVDFERLKFGGMVNTMAGINSIGVV